ncbi:MAG: hypothetical protein DWQ37_13420 [Planctomycetota bacterium]|nr:MAG: hypothetical protein DWQ37_13420 [Planctomycetota bacterium]
MALGKLLFVATAAAAIACSAAGACYAQLPEPPELLKRLWPFFRQQHPAPLAPAADERPTAGEEGEEKDRPLIAPFKPTKVDINNCTLLQLQALPGVTASSAARIMAGRPYRNFADLERDGIPLNVVRGLRGSVEFGR